MLAELLVQGGLKLVGNHPPEGSAYWAARYWDRDAAEQQAGIGDHYRSEKADIAKLIDAHARDVGSVLEVACGTGQFTSLLAQRSNAGRIIAMDISSQAIEIASERIDDPRVSFLQGDIWKRDDLGTHDVVMCIDAIHHLGEVSAALARLKRFLTPGGVLIGNLWTLDRYHELQRHRYGSLRHLWSSAMFLATAVLIRVSGGRLRTPYYRTHLVPSRHVGRVLHGQFSQVLYLEEAPARYFVAFACQDRRVPDRFAPDRQTVRQ